MLTIIPQFQAAAEDDNTKVRPEELRLEVVKICLIQVVVYTGAGKYHCAGGR